MMRMKPTLEDGGADGATGAGRTDNNGGRDQLDAQRECNKDPLEDRAF